MLLNLYSIKKEIKNVLEVDSDDAPYLLSQLDLALEEKADNIIKYARNCELAANSLQEEIDRVKALQKGLLSKADTAKKLIKTTMEEVGKKKIELDSFVLTVAKTPDKVIIENESLIPKKYFEVKQTHRVDKKKLKEDLKKGDVKGAKLESGTNLRVK